MTGGLAGVVAPLAAARRVLVPLSIALLASYAYFVDAPAWNQNSRLALTRALVERGSVSIDPDAATTGDKSFRDGRFYSDKAPGTSLVAAVPYAVLVAVRRATGGELAGVRVLPLDPRDAAVDAAPDPDQRRPGDKLVYDFGHRLALYVCGLFAVALPSLLGVAAVWLLARRAAPQDDRAATDVALTYGMGTLVLPYATVLYGHGLAAAALAIAFAIVVLVSPQAPGRAAPIAGALLGLSVATEYPVAVPAVVVVAMALALHGRRFAIGMVLGGLPWAVVLAVYHTAAFGHPLSTGYDYVYLPRFAEGMRVRYGFSAPDPIALWALLFGSYRGLFVLCPVLVLAAWGVVAGPRRVPTIPRAAWLAAIAIAAYHVLLNAGYYMWDGGASLGPRHVVPMLGPLALGLVVARRVVPGAFAVLAIVSVAQMVIGAAAHPEAAQFGHPLWEYAWPRVVDGDVGATGGATNLGRSLGLPGVWSLLPLALVWLWAWPSSPSEPADERQPDASGPGR